MMTTIQRIPRGCRADFHAGALARADGRPRDQNAYGYGDQGCLEQARAWARGWDAVDALIEDGREPTDAVCVALGSEPS